MMEIGMIATISKVTVFPSFQPFTSLTFIRQYRRGFKPAGDFCRHLIMMIWMVPDPNALGGWMTNKHNHSSRGKLHKNWRAWLVFLLMLAAVIMYVLTLDDSVVPR